MHARRLRARIGHIEIDVLTFVEALDEVERLVNARQGGTVFTPNVDHVVNAEKNERFRSAYRAASLSLVDGQPLVWASRRLGAPLLEKISGSDFVWPLLERAAKQGWRVYILGGGQGVAEKSAALLRERLGVEVVGIAAPMIETGNREHHTRVTTAMRDAHPDLVLVALGSPKQELLIHDIAERMKPAVFIGVGASLDFMVGAVTRAPKWMSRAGLEWLYRLIREPRRMWRRYLVHDVAFFGILLREIRKSSNVRGESSGAKSSSDHSTSI